MSIDIKANTRGAEIFNRLKAAWPTATAEKIDKSGSLILMFGDSLISATVKVLTPDVVFSAEDNFADYLYIFRETAPAAPKDEPVHKIAFSILNKVGFAGGQNDLHWIAPRTTQPAHIEPKTEKYGGVNGADAPEEWLRDIADRTASNGLPDWLEKSDVVFWDSMTAVDGRMTHACVPTEHALFKTILTPIDLSCY